MLSYSIIQKSQLEGANRLDAEFYQPEYLDLEDKITHSKYEYLRSLSLFIKKGIFDISPSKYKAAGVPLVRVKNIKNGFYRI